MILPEWKHLLTVILCHCRGSNGDEQLFETVFDKDKEIPEVFRENVRWVFPTTKKRYSTVFQEEMTEWVDVYSLSSPEAERERQRVGPGGEWEVCA